MQGDGKPLEGGMMQARPERRRFLAIEFQIEVRGANRCKLTDEKLPHHFAIIKMPLLELFPWVLTHENDSVR